jgi:hypothetical protein
MKRVMFLLIGIMMAGGMAAAATGNDSTIKATIPVGSTIVIPVSEGSKEVVFDVEGVEITALSDLEAVEGGRPVRDDPGESVAYSLGETDNYNGRKRDGQTAAEREARLRALLTTIKVIFNSVGMETTFIGATVIAISSQVAPNPATGEAILKASTLAAGEAITLIGISLNYVASKIPDYPTIERHGRADW